MKKVLFFACVALMAAMVVSCKKKLEGEALNTRYYSLVIPEGYKLSGSSNPDKSFMIVKLKEDGKTSEPGSMWFNVHAYSSNDKYHEPEEMKNNAVERGEIDKGEQQYGGKTYYVSLDEQYGKLKLRTKLADGAVLEVHVKEWNFEDPIIKEILDNVVIKETPDAVNPNYVCEYFSVKAPEGWVPEPSSSKVRMVKDDLSITVNTTTVPFEQVKENWKSFEPRGEVKVGDITWQVFVNDRSKLYNLLTDIASEPNKALTVTTFKVMPDDPELKKVLESIQLKK
jgi:hypothetical protein